MNLPQHVLDQIEQARKEGRVSGMDGSVPGASLPIEDEPAKEMPEKEFFWKVVNLAESLGWKVYHTFDSRRSEAGFLDLVLVRERVVWAELKKDKGQLTREQKLWIESLQKAKQEVYVWMPKDWNSVKTCLK